MIKIKAKLIRTWEELSREKSPTHQLEIDLKYGSGWIESKDNKKCFYLSTHTFYGENYKGSTKVLQDCGFNVEIDNWDKELSD